MEKLDGLTPHMKKVLITRVMCGSSEEAARVLGITVNTVKNNLHSIYRKLDTDNITTAYHKYLISIGDGVAQRLDEDFRQR